MQVSKYTLANEIGITYTFTLTFAKLSACNFLLRVTQNVQQPIRRVIHVLSTILTLMGLASGLVLCLQCFPLEHYTTALFPENASTVKCRKACARPTRLSSLMNNHVMSMNQS